MSQRPEIRFVALDASASPVVAALVGQDLHMPPALKAMDQKSSELICVSSYDVSPAPEFSRIGAERQHARSQ